MLRKTMAFLFALLLLLPAAALGETTALPYGLALGMNSTETEAAIAGNETLSAAGYNKLDDGGGVTEYVFGDLMIPGTELTATEFTVQVDCNNSAKEERLTSVTFNVAAPDDGIAAFRAALTALSGTLGAPETDPFDKDGVAQYVEWGTLDAAWTMEEVRVSLTLNRMYEESVSVLYSSRLNYDAADLAK